MFELGKPIFVMEFLSRVLANACKAGVMDVQYDDGRLDNYRVQDSCEEQEF